MAECLDLLIRFEEAGRFPGDKLYRDFKSACHVSPEFMADISFTWVNEDVQQIQWGTIQINPEKTMSNQHRYFQQQLNEESQRKTDLPQDVTHETIHHFFQFL